MRRTVDSTYVLWALLALPAVWFLAERFVLHGKVAFVPWTGILSCWFLILAMAVTPLQLIFGPLPWLKRRRRYFGVASFGYAFLHLFFWMINANMGALIRSFTRTEILTGWVAMAVMTVLAATSYDGAVRTLGPKWKTIQRWIYPMAVLTLVHWVMTTDHLMDVVIYCGPLVVLYVWRVWRYQSRLRKA
ncbi:Protein-methionine-sulfoxide reductase heme-binding subunit MsrQ [Defluviimonas aquaemixtae]|uniref:Protein-methionine-sulfoxide reductase heme-binding subunit MsrQ n=1 Tax=Albidovulum aquaemixtae TaxID=1542388 RepID=A0A2R8B2K0_9RHOB|nr:ferric reductase-like transmembrane domain-containing protein [Defluviimonas aquaemixtae]SPH16828.1 Protein-methionine-sulfoxide reductase heme-binding subunit MsrQ [Defluviimonas aquaemixtae]